jgi:hypothetical protein
VQRQSRKASKGTLLTALAAAAFFLAILPHGRFALDLRMGANGARAAFALGLISFRIAFDSGRSCPESNSCRSTIL